MNPDLQKCRQHYGQLSSHTKERDTAQFLLKAIEIAEKAMDALKTCRELCDEVKASEAALKRELARVTKPEGE